MKVLVPGYGGRLRLVERWRMKVAVATLATHGGGELVVSGHRGEAERLAALAPPDVAVHLEVTARSTQENIERSTSWLEGADRIAVASDYFHVRRAARHLRQHRPELATRLVPTTRSWPRGWWMDVAGAGHCVLRWLRSRWHPHHPGRLIRRFTAPDRPPG